MMIVPQTSPAMAPYHAPGLVDVMTSRFTGKSGVSECNFMLRPVVAGNFREQLAWLDSALQRTLSEHGLSRRNIIFRRFFCSESPGHVEALRNRAFSNPDGVVNGGVSVLIQPPVTPALVTLWVYCIDGQPLVEGNGASTTLKRGSLEHVWSTGLTATRESGAGQQTSALFDRYSAFLERRDMTLQQHCLRTWFYVRDVDNDYGDFVKARNERFYQHGLTPSTHFIASTGIEGAGTDPHALVMMDAYAVKGLRPGQVRHLKALDHLPDTHVYGVAFERATEVAYDDRKHILVSGTASIDANGEVVHGGDVCRQLGRTLLNIEVLLGQANAALADMQHLVAYVRNPADAEVVHELLGKCVETTAYLVVTGAVCRPEWLVEIEGIAITANNNSLPGF